MRILSDSTVSSLSLCMKYLMDLLHWKNQAIGYLAWDPQMITASALTTSTLAHFNSPIKTSTSITNISVNQNIRKIGLSDEKVSSTTYKGEATLIDPTHIAAVLIGQLHTVHFLDVVDWKGIHLFLAYMPSNIPPAPFVEEAAPSKAHGTVDSVVFLEGIKRTSSSNKLDGNCDHTIVFIAPNLLTKYVKSKF